MLETSQAVVSSLDSQVVLNRILEQVEKLLGLEKSAIVALDSQKGVFAAKASRGLTSRYTEGLVIYPRETASVTMRAIHTETPIIIQDTEIDPSFEPYRPRARAEGYRSFAAIPLKLVHSAPAALVLYSPVPNSFTDTSIDLLVNFANQAAMAIENAELFARSDTRLQEQTRRLESLIQSLEAGLVLEDLNGNILFVNRTICDLAEMSRDLIIGKPAKELYKKILGRSTNHEEDISKVNSILFGAAEQAISLSLESDHQQRYYRLKGFNVTDSAGMMIGKGQILRDITRDYEIDRMKTSLISTVSHELRTPLAAIKGYATTLLADDVDWEIKAQEEFIEIISSEADRLSELVNNLLDMSRIEAGSLKLSKGYCDLTEIIHRGASQAYPNPGNRLIIEIADEIPIIEADPQRLEVVVRNLVENAAKYAENDLPITVSAKLNDGHIIVRVEDFGPGIPPGNREQVFESFFRLENGLTRKTPGVGLGLAISRGLIAAHHGQIWFEPREQGTCIAFSIPLTLHLQEDAIDTKKMEQSK
ncbi:MAG: GAF domain-containing protein [Aliifodinibius sp.]|nr:GAF domain-containing protein [Fodinibius sp.]